MVVFRTFLFYFALIAVIRGLGKRQGGQMEPSEFVVTMLIANLASLPLEDWSIPVWGGLVPMASEFDRQYADPVTVRAARAAVDRLK